MRAMPFLVFGALAVAAFAWAWRNNRADALRLILWVVPALVAVGGFLFGTHDFGERWLWGAAACVALFVLNIGMIHAGLAAGRESWINLGVAMIALNILTRYLDLFGTMLEGGVFFLVTGIIVLGLGLYLERKRRGFMAVLRKDRA